MINLDRANKENIQLILDKCAELDVKKRTHRAYILATAYHETNGTFNPVREAYWLDDPDAYLRKHHPEYYPYYGRGFAQLTWHHNYKKYEDLLHVPLTSNPDLALDPDIAAFIIVHGMTTGTFTQKRLYDYILLKCQGLWRMLEYFRDYKLWTVLLYYYGLGRTASVELQAG